MGTIQNITKGPFVVHVCPEPHPASVSTEQTCGPDPGVALAVQTAQGSRTPNEPEGHVCGELDLERFGASPSHNLTGEDAGDKEGGISATV